MPPRPWPSLLLVGPTGSGKTPLGDEIERRGLLGRHCLHFDFGANLRAAAEQAGDFGLTPREVKTVRASLTAGTLFGARDMPMIVKILNRSVETRRLTTEALLVLNGLPRHRDQAEALASVVAVERAVSLEAEAAVIRARILLDTGRDRAGREDDTIEAILRRLNVFRERTEPLLGFYRRQGVPVHSIAVTAGMTAAAMYAILERLIVEG